MTVTGEGNNLKVNDAGLVCGGVSTANAQVYMIDTVLMPPARTSAEQRAAKAPDTPSVRGLLRLLGIIGDPSKTLGTPNN